MTENSSQENIVIVNFVIDNAFVGYTQPERDGLFGDFFTERTTQVSGNYLFIRSIISSRILILPKKTQ